MQFQASERSPYASTTPFRYGSPMVEDNGNSVGSGDMMISCVSDSSSDLLVSEKAPSEDIWDMDSNTVKRYNVMHGGGGNQMPSHDSFAFPPLEGAMDPRWSNGGGGGVGTGHDAMMYAQQNFSPHHHPAHLQQPPLMPHHYAGDMSGMDKWSSPSPSAVGAAGMGGGQVVAEREDQKRPKSYQCEPCDKWFTSSGHLKRHYNTTLHKNAIRHRAMASPPGSGLAGGPLGPGHKQMESYMGGPPQGMTNGPPLTPQDLPNASSLLASNSSPYDEHSISNSYDSSSTSLPGRGAPLSGGGPGAPNFAPSPHQQDLGLNNHDTSVATTNSSSSSSSSSAAAAPGAAPSASPNVPIASNTPSSSPSLYYNYHGQGSGQQPGGQVANRSSPATNSESPHHRSDYHGGQPGMSPAAAAAASSNGVSKLNPATNTAVPISTSSTGSTTPGVPPSGPMDYNNQNMKVQMQPPSAPSSTLPAMSSTTSSPSCLYTSSAPSAQRPPVGGGGVMSGMGGLHSNSYSQSPQQTLQDCHGLYSMESSLSPYDHNSNNSSNSIPMQGGPGGGRYDVPGGQNRGGGDPMFTVQYGGYAPYGNGDYGAPNGALYAPGDAYSAYSVGGDDPNFDNSSTSTTSTTPGPPPGPTPAKMPKMKRMAGDRAGNDVVGEFRCNECNKVFTRICYLKQHNKSFHNGEKPYKCNQCGKRFPLETLYQEHMAKHSGDKPYKCDVCPKQFNHKTDLRRHMCLHTGEKPFTCETCGKGFIREDRMIKHADTHKKKAPMMIQ